MAVWRAVAALYLVRCRGCDRLRDRWRFHRRGPDNLVDGFSGVVRRRALNIGALVVQSVLEKAYSRFRPHPLAWERLTGVALSA